MYVRNYYSSIVLAFYRQLSDKISKYSDFFNSSIKADYYTLIEQAVNYAN